MCQINNEIRICSSYWKCYPLHYFRYDLYRKDKKLSREDLINYIPEFFFYNLFLPYYDSNKFEIILKDKIITEHFFRSLNISQPETLAKLINNNLYTFDLKNTAFDYLNREINVIGYKKIFIKSADGMGGYGIYIFTKNNMEHFLARDDLSFTEKFLKDIEKK